MTKITPPYGYIPPRIEVIMAVHKTIIAASWNSAEISDDDNNDMYDGIL